MTNPITRRRAQASAHLADVVAGVLAVYALLALVCALVQANKVGDIGLAGSPGSTVGWFAWWALTGLFAVVCAAASVVIATLLKYGPAAPDPVETPAVDDHR